MKYGVDIHERTDFGDGQSVLDVAYDHHDEDSSFIQWLESIAEIDMEAGPDLWYV